LSHSTSSFLGWVFSCELLPGLPSNRDPPDLCLLSSKITGVNHWHPAYCHSYVQIWSLRPLSPPLSCSSEWLGPMCQATNLGHPRKLPSSPFCPHQVTNPPSILPHEHFIMHTLPHPNSQYLTLWTFTFHWDICNNLLTHLCIFSSNLILIITGF
jgi:hypothetical protein